MLNEVIRSVFISVDYYCFQTMPLS